MTNSAAIIVEGKDDLRFVRQYLRHLRFDGLLFDGELKTADVAGKFIAIREIGGIDTLTGNEVPNDVIETARASDKVLIIADANANPQKRRKQLQNTAEKIKAKTNKSAEIFLLPDDKRAGELEDLLMGIFRDGGVGDCLKQYEACLKLKGKKLQAPDKKGIIYAYCEAHRVETNAVKRKYRDSPFWDLEHSALLPLREFLMDNLPSPDGEEG